MTVEQRNIKYVIAILICLMLIGTIVTCIIVGDDNEEILYDQEDLTAFYSQKDSMKMNNKAPTSSMSDSKTLVLQIDPEWRPGHIEINGKIAPKIGAYVVIPNLDKTISCLSDYFQENASLPGKWINDSGDKRKLEHIDELRTVVITVMNQGREEMCELPDDYGIRLLDYFNLDICHNPARFKHFDCYAFVSLLANVKYYRLKPGFDYFDEQAKVGDIVALASDLGLPNSIKHWALYLGDDIYLSKYGMSGEGAQCLLEATNLKGMMTLYDCKHVFIARPNSEAEPWDGYTFQLNK